MRKGLFWVDSRGRPVNADVIGGVAYGRLPIIQQDRFSR